MQPSFYLSNKRIIQKLIDKAIVDNGGVVGGGSGGSSTGSGIAQYASRSALPASPVVDTVVYLNDEDIFLVYNGASEGWQEAGEGFFASKKDLEVIDGGDFS